MLLLPIKIVSTAGLIAGATLAVRRWGQMIGGWLVGLPLTSGPVAFFLALQHGTGFAATAATGMLTGTASQVVFALCYAWAGSFRWPIAFLSGTLGFAAFTPLLLWLPFSAPVAFVFVICVLLLGLRLLPAAEGVTAARTHIPWWDLAGRITAATLAVTVLTTIASRIGPHLSGLLSPFPLFGAIMTIAAHHLHGSGAVTSVLRGLTWGLFAPASFFLTLATTLPIIGLAAGFASAATAATLTQLLTLVLFRHRTQTGGFIDRYTR